MAKRAAPDDPLLTTEEVAERYGKKPRTVEDWRYKRIGPQWLTLTHSAVRYRLSDLLAWEQQAKGA